MSSRSRVDHDRRRRRRQPRRPDLADDRAADEDIGGRRPVGGDVEKPTVADDRRAHVRLVM
jgi:hypothetical protein